MTEITPAPKEEPIPIELEKKSDVKAEPKSEEVTPEVEITAVPETNEKKEELPSTITEGYLQKRTPKTIMKIWSKSYFTVGTDPISLDNLRLYHKKNVKKVPSETAPAETEVVEKIISKVEEPALETIEPTKAEEPVAEATETTKAEESVVETAEPPKTEVPVAETTEVSKPEEPVVAASTDAEKVDETKEPEDKKPEIKEQPISTTIVEEEAKHAETNVSNSYYKNIAHATKTGNGLLFYYKSDSDARNKKQPLGIINLKEVDGVDKVYPIDDCAGKPFVFKVETNYRLFELAAESNVERDRWIKTIKEKIEEADKIDVESSEEYKATYSKLEGGNAFINHKSDNIMSDTEMFSGDEENTDPPKRNVKNVDPNRRRSVFTQLFFGGRKASTSDATTLVTTSETINEDGTKEVITETSEIITTEEVLKTEDIKTEEGSPKSPHKPSRFPFNISFSKKVEKGHDTKEETTTSEIIKEVVVKEKATEEATNAEASAAVITANGVEVTEENKDEKHEEKHKKGWIENLNLFKKVAGKETQKEEITETEETNTEQTKADHAETPAEEEAHEIRHKEHKDGIFKNLFKGKAKDETPHETKGETTEVVNEASAEDTTIEAKGEGKTETEEKSAETPTDKQDDHSRTILGVKLPFGAKSKHVSEEKTETSEDKVESKSDEQVEPKKSENKEEKDDEKKEDKKEKKEKSKKEKKKKEKEHEKEKKEADDSSSTSSSSSDSSGGGVVRRVTQIWRRNKSHKTDSSHREVVNEASEENEEKKEAETSEAKSTEKVEKAPEQTIPESSNESTEDKVKKDDEKKKEKTSIFENLKRISSGLGKRQNSLPQEATHEKVESTDSAAVASALEATDVENVDKKAKIEENESVQNILKKGNLHKQTQFRKNLEIRYFELTKDKKLVYNRSETDFSATKSIDLSDSKVKLSLVKAHEGKSPYLFDLETKTRTFKIGADTEEERDSWIQSLKEVGVTLVSAPTEKEQPTSSQKTEEVSTRLEVTKSETNLQEEIDAVAASVSETQEPTTTSDIVETKEEKETTA
ncbi:13894_t:CDS:2 [Funneliformis geosporum]|uniref:18226_t:CDS:1 n=1 Tax=Funneliformis geosporum TaxID=1117311 RepID=A0A9W4SR24_9GLOM|nr:13894_t:CDS:2 [Funneliformis geosporum]CAI2178485.1 18226_t:CDS:2 [Funneliformis geosporum]